MKEQMMNNSQKIQRPFYQIRIAQSEYNKYPYSSLILLVNQEGIIVGIAFQINDGFALTTAASLIDEQGNLRKDIKLISATYDKTKTIVLKDPQEGEMKLSEFKFPKQFVERRLKNIPDKDSIRYNWALIKLPKIIKQSEWLVLNEGKWQDIKLVLNEGKQQDIKVNLYGITVSGIQNNDPLRKNAVTIQPQHLKGNIIRPDDKEIKHSITSPSLKKGSPLIRRFQNKLNQVVGMHVCTIENQAFAIKFYPQMIKQIHDWMCAMSLPKNYQQPTTMKTNLNFGWLIKQPHQKELDIKGKKLTKITQGEITKITSDETISLNQIVNIHFQVNLKRSIQIGLLAEKKSNQIIPEQQERQNWEKIISLSMQGIKINLPKSKLTQPCKFSANSQQVSLRFNPYKHEISLEIQKNLLECQVKQLFTSEINYFLQITLGGSNDSIIII